MSHIARFALPAITVLALFGAAPTASALGQKGPSLADMLPADTFLYVSGDARAFQTGLRSLGLAELLREEEVRDFLMPLYEQTGMVDPADPMGSLVDGLAISEWIQGEIGLGFSGISFHMRDGSKFGLSPSQPITANLFHQLASVDDAPFSRIGFDFLATLDPGPALRSHVHDFLQNPPQGCEIGSVHIEGQELLAINVSLEDEISTTIYADISGDRWLISGDQTRLATALTGGPQASLADSASWKSFSSRLKTRGNVLFAFADVAGALGIVERCIPPILMEEASILGVDGLQGLGFGMSMSDGGVRESILLGFDGDPQGILSLFDAFGGGFPSLDGTPADTAAFIGLRFDPMTLMDRVQKLLARTAPRIGPDVLAELDTEGPGGHDLFEDVLPALGSELSIAVSPPKSGMVPNLILSVDIRDPKKFAAILETAKSMAQQGGDVVVKPLPLKGGAEGFALQIDEAPIQPAFCVRGNRLYGAVSPLTLKSYVYRHLESGDRKTLGESGSALPRVVEAVSGGRTELPALLVALDLERAIPFIYDSAAPFLSGALDESGTGLDAAMLPMSETLQPHLSGIGAAISRGDDGISIDLFSPTGLLTLGAIAGAMDSMHHGGPVVHHYVDEGSGDTD